MPRREIVRTAASTAIPFFLFSLSPPLIKRNSGPPTVEEDTRELEGRV